MGTRNRPEASRAMFSRTEPSVVHLHESPQDFLAEFIANKTPLAQYSACAFPQVNLLIDHLAEVAAKARTKGISEVTKITPIYGKLLP